MRTQSRRHLKSSKNELAFFSRVVNMFPLPASWDCALCSTMTSVTSSCARPRTYTLIWETAKVSAWTYLRTKNQRWNLTCSHKEADDNHSNCRLEQTQKHVSGREGSDCWGFDLHLETTRTTGLPTMINAHCFPFTAPNRPRLPKSRVVMETKYMI